MHRGGWWAEGGVQKSFRTGNRADAFLGELWERAMTQMLRPTHGNRPDDAVSCSDTEEAPLKVYS